jgi:RNA polymerase-binding transcription factor DksA
MTCHIAVPRYAPTEKHTAEKRACFVCGKLIAPPRLLMLPETRRCDRCAESLYSLSSTSS